MRQSDFSQQSAAGRRGYRPCQPVARHVQSSQIPKVPDARRDAPLHVIKQSHVGERNTRGVWAVERASQPIQGQQLQTISSAKGLRYHSSEAIHCKGWSRKANIDKITQHHHVCAKEKDSSVMIIAMRVFMYVNHLKAPMSQSVEPQRFHQEYLLTKYCSTHQSYAAAAVSLD